MRADFTLPRWDHPAHERPVLSAEAYLDWLSQERAELLREGKLDKLRVDPARCPVDARFVWSS